ncbi:transcriptional attenuator, LytR family [Rivularia sp. PCC 7116]|uniref:LCP family protein n=1 Tax=Rivularia sp. PCC 7116 TaxID=373994 RepID=UPI00029EEA6E|nr:transcriptional attenuator, LytR family [Rivularia sp. PCC 7116]
MEKLKELIHKENPQTNDMKHYQPKSKRGFWGKMGIVAIVSALAGGLFGVFLTGKPFMQANLSPEEANFFNDNAIDRGKFLELNRPVNILVMGMSVLPPDTKNAPEDAKDLGYLPQVNSFDGLSDVMLLIRFDPENNKLNMLSIPRDTRTEIEGYGLRKINSANRLGGAYLSAKSVSNLLGNIDIHGYVRINVLGVGKLIDALGGVTVNVPKDLKYQDDSQHLYINLKAGEQHLDGDKALQLLRFRNDGRGDIGRIERQQLVMQALIQQALNPATLARSPVIIGTIKDNIDTNLNLDSLLTLVNFGVQTNRSDIEMFTLPGRVSNGREYNASYWLPDEEGIDELMVRYFEK